jgi:hypothetical protein
LNLSNTLKAGAATLFLAIAVGVLYQGLSTGPEAAQGHITVFYPPPDAGFTVTDGGLPDGGALFVYNDAGGAPSRARVWVTALASPGVIHAFGVSDDALSRQLVPGWRTDGGVVLVDAGAPDGGVLAVQVDAGFVLVDGGPQGFAYFRGKVCVPIVDAGSLPDGGDPAPDPGPNLLGGMTIVYDDPIVTGCDAGEPDFEAWVEGRPDAPFQCACSTGSACSVPTDDGGTVAAPLHITLQPGWSGAGCLPKACMVLSGLDAWPGGCP